MALASNVWTNLLGRENPHVILNSGAVPVLGRDQTCWDQA